jgi:hypothetical protein
VVPILSNHQVIVSRNRYSLKVFPINNKIVRFISIQSILIESSIQKQDNQRYIDDGSDNDLNDEDNSARRLVNVEQPLGQNRNRKGPHNMSNDPLANSP